MTTWLLSPQYKKSAVEKMFFYKEGKIITIEQGFRWGTFTVQSDERPLTDYELKNEDGYELGSIDNDESWELCDLSDGCWCDIEIGNDKTTSTDLEEFQAAWDADWYSGVEALGWSNDDTEYYYYGPLSLTNEDTGEEFLGEPENAVQEIDPDASISKEEIAEFIDNHADFIENMTDEEYENLGKDDNPYTDWFPASINPVRVGTYQVLDCEQEVSWPFQSNILAGTWDGKKWDISVSTTVVKWRGLAKNPEGTK
jgi:hypothetical protein